MGNAFDGQRVKVVQWLEVRVPGRSEVLGCQSSPTFESSGLQGFQMSLAPPKGKKKKKDAIFLKLSITFPIQAVLVYRNTSFVSNKDTYVGLPKILWRPLKSGPWR